MSYQKNATINTLLPELNPNQLKLLHRALLEYVIGEDESSVSQSGWKTDYVVTSQNLLKDKQRAALQAFLGLKE